MQIDASGMLVVATGTLAFAVVQPDKTVVPNVFVVAINVLADGTASVIGDGTHNSIIANLTLVNVSMTLASSTIGPVFLQPLQSALNIFTEVRTAVKRAYFALLARVLSLTHSVYVSLSLPLSLSLSLGLPF